MAFIILFSLSACGEDYVPLGETRVEWDKSDPKIHNQQITFNQRMSYALLEERHLDKNDPNRENETMVEIGRKLVNEDTPETEGLYTQYGYTTEAVPDGMIFTIESSFWLRRGWIQREFNGDLHFLVLRDENNIRSSLLFVMLYYSNKPELEKMKNEGRFK